MEQQATTTGKALVGRPSNQMIQEMITEFEESKFTVEEYCEYKGLNIDTFQSWITKHKSKEEKAGNFVPVTIKEDEPNGEMLFAEVRGIRIYQRVEADYLKSLIS